MSVTSATVKMQRPEVSVLGPEKDNRQRFTFGPLEPGFGHTLGSSMRRTLLSAIPGAAVTQVRFDDVLHEFDTIKGVVEDVTDMVLNFKDVVLRSDSDTPIAVRLDAEGPGVVQAGDLDWGSEVECLTPELHLATLSDDARLAVDITVERGWGYLPSSDLSSTGEIGLIPIDAIFSPVRRVAIEVEPTRVEQSTNYDMLVLDIETDGALTPREALSSAGDTLCSLYTLMSALVEEELGLGMVTNQRSNEFDSPDLELLLDDIGLSQRTVNGLKRASINSVGEVLENSMEELMAIPNFGQKALEELTEKLDELGFSLSGDDSSDDPDEASAGKGDPGDDASDADKMPDADKMIGETNGSASSAPDVIGDSANGSADKSAGAVASKSA